MQTSHVCSTFFNCLKVICYRKMRNKSERTCYVLVYLKDTATITATNDFISHHLLSWNCLSFICVHNCVQAQTLPSCLCCPDDSSWASWRATWTRCWCPSRRRTSPMCCLEDWFAAGFVAVGVAVAVDAAFETEIAVAVRRTWRAC